MNKKRKIHIGILTVVLLGLLTSMFTPLSVSAETVDKITEPMVLSFSTSVIKTSSKNNAVLDQLDIVLRYQVYPQRNGPANYPAKTITVNNGEVINFTETMDVEVTLPENKVYKGKFTYVVSYDTSTSKLIVNGNEVRIGNKILMDASVYPEAWLPSAVIGIDMDPLPFSLVKAIRSSSPGYVNQFNSRINGLINQTIELSTDKYGANIQTNTKLALFVNQWKRLPDGTYDKRNEPTRVQVIFTAADFLNGLAPSNGWDGTQYYRQVVPVDSYGITTSIERVQVGTINRIYYTVQNRTGTSYVWGFNGVENAVSGVIEGTYRSSSNTRLVQNYYKYSRYEIECSDYWRLNRVTHWSSRRILSAGGTQTGTSGGDAFCRAQNPRRPYFRQLKSTETTSWLTALSRTGYSRTATGYSYQIQIPRPTWGASYETTTRPTDSEITMGAKRIISQRLRQDAVMGNVEMVAITNTVIEAANMLTEAGVNSRVSQYANGLAINSILGAGSLSLSAYNTVFNATRAAHIPSANTLFREGSYWGLYLYQTGHWRAVEVPIAWYSISVLANRPAELIAEPVPPPADPDTDISLIEFDYVQARFNSLKLSNQQKTLVQIQQMLVDELRIGENKAGKKFVLYFDVLRGQGLTTSQAMTRLSKELNLNLTTK